MVPKQIEKCIEKIHRLDLGSSSSVSPCPNPQPAAVSTFMRQSPPSTRPGGSSAVRAPKLAKRVPSFRLKLGLWSQFPDGRDPFWKNPRFRDETDSMG